MHTKKRILENRRGLTLVALVLCTIAIIILTTITIKVIAKEENTNKENNQMIDTSTEEIREEIELIAITSFKEKGKIDREKLNNNIKDIEGLTYNGLEINESNKIEALPAIVKVDTNEFLINDDGTVNLSGPSAEITEKRVVENADGTGEEVAIRSKIEYANKLYISFKANLPEGNITTISCGDQIIEPQEDRYVFEVSKNGIYNFKIIGTINGQECETPYSVLVDKYEKRAGIKVGDYVSYTAPTRDDYILSSKVSGTSTDQTLSQENKKWRVLNINEDGSMDLIAVLAPSDKKIQFQGSLGYNNGVYVLNDMCKYLYQNEEKGITARNINYEDIVNKMNGIETATGLGKIEAYQNTQLSKIGASVYIENIDIANKSVTYNNEYAFYPEIYKRQIGSGINTSNVLKKEDEYEKGKRTITESDVFYEEPTSKTKEKADELTVKYSYYYGNILASDFTDFDGKNSMNYNILFPWGIHSWVASRYSNCSWDGAYFGIRSINGNILYGENLFSSTGNDYYNNNCVCPIVTISPDVQVTNSNGVNGLYNFHTVVTE